MTREAQHHLTQQARAGVRRVPWRTVLAGAGGASVVALLAVSGVGPLVSAVAAGTLALPVVQGWLANLGANALSGWLAAWAISATSTALTVTELEQRAAELEQHTIANSTLAPALAQRWSKAWRSWRSRAGCYVGRWRGSGPASATATLW